MTESPASSKSKKRLFLYDTLCVPRILEHLLNLLLEPNLLPATLTTDAYQLRMWVHFPALVASSDHKTRVIDGMIYDCHEMDLPRVYRYEGDNYHLQEVEVVQASETQTTKAWAFVWCGPDDVFTDGTHTIDLS